MLAWDYEEIRQVVRISRFMMVTPSMYERWATLTSASWVSMLQRSASLFQEGGRLFRSPIHAGKTISAILSPMTWGRFNQSLQRDYVPISRHIVVLAQRLIMLILRWRRRTR